MKEFNIKGSERKEVGKNDARKLRKNGYVPCIIYGAEKNIHFYTELKSFNNLVYTPNVYIVNIDLDGKVHKAIMQDIQFHPVTDKIIHVDFYEIFMDQPVGMNIPVKIVGNSPGVLKGGNLRQKRRDVYIRGLPKDFPDVLNVDITGLEIGDNVHIYDLEFENLEVLDPPEAMVVSVDSPKRMAKSMMEAEEGEEGAEGAEGEAPAEGEAATEGEAGDAKESSE
jgi:large subunit ribosomal protein L25